jgi:hypothetical protein
MEGLGERQDTKQPTQPSCTMWTRSDWYISCRRCISAFTAGKSRHTSRISLSVKNFRIQSVEATALSSRLYLMCNNLVSSKLKKSNAVQLLFTVMAISLRASQETSFAVKSQQTVDRFRWHVRIDHFHTEYGTLLLSKIHSRIACTRIALYKYVDGATCGWQ